MKLQTTFLTEQLRHERAEKDAEVKRLRAALREIADLSGTVDVADHMALAEATARIVFKAREALGE